MNNLKTFDLNIETVVMRFYLMMGVVIIAGFSGYWLLALLALPIFLSIMMGISFKKDNTKVSTKKYSSLSSAPKTDIPNVA